MMKATKLNFLFVHLFVFLFFSTNTLASTTNECKSQDKQGNCISDDSKESSKQIEINNLESNTQNQVNDSTESSDDLEISTNDESSMDTTSYEEN